MSNVPPTSPDQLDRHFLNLPRELRDLIYAYAATQDSPFVLTDRNIQVPLDHPVISAEWLEATYTHNTCSVAFSDFRLLRDSKVQRSLWGSYPQYKRFIRHLVVNASEVVLWQDDLEKLELECTVTKPEVRQEWNELLELPCLESLTIYLQKWSSTGFSWANFSPIVYQLREQVPKLHIVFNVSFDVILENKWNIDLTFRDELGDRTARTHALEEDPYLPMGFVNMSELFKPPTDEDRVYVGEHLSGTRDIGSMDIVRGLLDETPANRRLLAQHYVVREPALLKVLMCKHYEIHKQARGQKKDEVGAADNGD